MSTPPHQEAQFVYNSHVGVFLCEGEWTTTQLFKLSQASVLEQPLSTSLQSISGEKLIALDSAGALMLNELYSKLKVTYPELTLINFRPEQKRLLELVATKQDIYREKPSGPETNSILYKLGKETVQKLQQIDGLIILVGDLANKLFYTAVKWQRLQIPSIISNISATGIQALPILALLSFLIGVVLAYQMGLQLETYGANNFISYLCGMAIFREFAPLITAIIVAGRTSSAFTAQIGSMKINQEIDALQTMGLSPTEYLVIPKVLALLLIFPLIIFWSDIFSLLGSMIMAKFMLNVSYVDFLTRIQNTVGLKQLLLGLYKAPAFALLIALVGCHQGFLVSFSSDSVGKQTTKSVVQALFLIIVADAIYSIIYSWLNL
jgi:phospholipid/cholesterol/gamma-HCH transport system permease protein